METQAVTRDGCRCLVWLSKKFLGPSSNESIASQQHSPIADSLCLTISLKYWLSNCMFFFSFYSSAASLCSIRCLFCSPVPPPLAYLESLACLASVSVRFRSKERGTRIKGRAKNGVSKRAGRGWGRKEGNACRQTPGFWKPPTWPVMPEFAHRHLMLSSAVIIDQ